MEYSVIYDDSNIQLLYNYTAMKKILFILFPLLLISSCKTKQSITDTTTKIDTIYIETKVIDSVKVKEIIEVVKPTKQKINVSSLCDSIGKSKDINFELNNGNVKLSIKDNNLNLEVTTDSIKNHYRDFYHAQYKNDSIALSSKEKQVKTDVTIKYKAVKWTYVFFTWGLLATYLYLRKIFI